ncbi:MAG: hypothetical protein EU532_12690 [Promethearchaeota archaeon]|nr:MAG: hypothetical protein EU532_12690 [Candidatus Lokiarchaeota archaeon]
MNTIRIRLFVSLLIIIDLILPTTILNIGYISAHNNPPTARFLPGMVYDDINERVIMFGGGYTGGLLDDTWVFDYALNSWTQLNPPTSPAARSGHVMVYDSINEIIILFGGYWSSSPRDDTWIFNCATNDWIQVFPEIKPPARMSHNMIYDSVNERVILFSGYGIGGELLNDTWEYDYSINTWVELRPKTSPGPRYGHCMIYNSHSERVILFSGATIESDQQQTWEYDYTVNEWIELSPPSSPLGRKWGVMIYDSVNQKAIMFGGSADPAGPEYSDDTWKYDYSLNNWIQCQPTISPPGRSSEGLVYDSLNQKVILFGGMGNNHIPLSDTWIYSYNIDNWVNCNPVSHHLNLGDFPIEFLIIGTTLSVVIIIAMIIWIFKHSSRNKSSNQKY